MCDVEKGFRERKERKEASVQQVLQHTCEEEGRRGGGAECDRAKEEEASFKANALGGGRSLACVCVCA